MKTRVEQIREAAWLEYPKPESIDVATRHVYMREAFQRGCEWADQNKDQNFISSFERELSEQVSRLEMEVERLSAPLTIPEGEIEKQIERRCNYSNRTFFMSAVRWALEFLNKERP